MERKKENKLSMYDTIDKICETYQDQVNLIPFFPGYRAEYKTILTEIHGRNETLELNIKGSTAVKREKRMALVDATMNIALKVRAYAIHTENTELEQQVNYHRWLLLREPDSVLSDICMLIHNIAAQILTELVTAGVTQSMLDEQVVKMNEYINYSAIPRVKRVEKKEWKYQMNLLFGKADKLLKKMDGMVSTLMIDNPEAFNTYMGARQIVDLKGKQKYHTGITGVITDFETEEAIEGAEVWTDNCIAHAMTDKTGAYNLETKGGNTKFYVRKTGYTAYVEEIETETNVIIENDIELEKPEGPVEAGNNGTAGTN